MILRGLPIALLILYVTTSHALGPHEIAVLVNRDSPRSMEVANRFIHLRNIPPRNVIYLSVPEQSLEPASQITPEQFKRYIWEPANNVIEERGLDHILAWIYSVDFPVRITTSPPMSILGLTFTRNTIPDREEIRMGEYRSLLFAGPDGQGGAMSSGGSLDVYWDELDNRMPLPAMMLGFMGARGTDMQTINRYLDHGVLSDGTRPQGTVYFVRSDDIRSEMREWQFENARDELERAGIQAEITDTPPRQERGIMGVMMGSASVDVPETGMHRPGSMSEHVTSHAAEFHLPIHTKLTDWLRHGSTASAGTVTEPLSIWTKFPHARFFAHYSRGNSILESFYQSIRSPTQILLVGEPLARPWKPPISATLVSLQESPMSGSASFAVGLLPELPNIPVMYEYYLNGQPIAKTEDIMLTLDTEDLADGHHTLRATAYAGGPIRHQAYGIMEFHVNNRQRYVHLKVGNTNEEVDYYRPIPLQIEVEGEDNVETGIFHNEREIPYTTGEEKYMEIDPFLLGRGPVELQAFARFEDDMEVRSAPLALTISDLNKPPDITEPERIYTEHGESVLRPMATDPEGDTIHFRWYADIHSLGEPSLTGDKGQLDSHKNGYLLTPADTDGNTGFAIAAFPGNIQGLAAVRARINVQDSQQRHPRNEMAGIVFNYRKEDDFYFFGLWGRQSAWMLAHRSDGRWRRLVTRGAFIQTGKSYDVAVRISRDGRLEGLVNDRVVLEKSDPQIHTPGKIGLLAEGKPVRIEEPLYSARGGFGEYLRIDSDGEIRISNSGRIKTDTLTLEAHDGFHSSFRRIKLLAD